MSIAAIAEAPQVIAPRHVDLLEVHHAVVVQVARDKGRAARRRARADH